MLREQSFSTTFTTQLAGATATQPIHANSHEDLSPSDYPAFSLELGKTHYHGPDADGFFYTAHQDFTVTIFFRYPQLKLDDALVLRSAYLQTIESFINSGYLVPAMLPGDLYRITSIDMLEVLPPEYERTETRFTLTIKGRYNFIYV